MGYINLYKVKTNFLSYLFLLVYKRLECVDLRDPFLKLKPLEIESTF